MMIARELIMAFTMWFSLRLFETILR